LFIISIIIIIILFLLIGQTIGYSQNTTTTVISGPDSATRLQSDIGGLSIGYIKVGSEEVGNLAWHPDLRVGPFGMGADINVALGQNKPSGYEHVVLRYAEYDE
jgi:hypothetical protein